MQRRTFIQKSSASGLALSLAPALMLPQGSLYSTAELMGKEKIALFGKDINLRESAHDAFLEMKKAAYSDGFNITIVSSYRDFAHQESIWERKYLQYTADEGMPPMQAIDKIIAYSTIPGTSRHHWGTDIDIIDGYPRTSGDVLDPIKFGEGGPFTNFKKWLDENSKRFHFYLVYTNSPKRRGFKYEPWHYSYAPIAIDMLGAFRKKNIMQLIQKEEIAGSEHFTSGFLRTYITDNILDINTELL